MRSFYPDSEALSQDLNTYNQDFLDGIMGTYLKNVDFSKFREGRTPLHFPHADLDVGRLSARKAYPKPAHPAGGPDG